MERCIGIGTRRKSLAGPAAARRKFNVLIASRDLRLGCTEFGASPNEATRRKDAKQILETETRNLADAG